MAFEVKYDVRGEPEAGESGPVLPPNLYDVKIKDIQDKVSKSSGNKMLEVTFQVLKGEHKGATIRNWITYADSDGEPLESAKFKVAELVRALGKKDKGSVTPKDIGTKIQIKVDADTYDGKPSARVGRMLKLGAVADEEDVEEEEDEDEDGEETESDSDGDDAEDESDEDEDEESDEEADEEEDEDEELDLTALSLDDLKTLCKEHGIKPTAKKDGEPVKGAKLKNILIKRLQKALEDAEDPFA